MIAIIVTIAGFVLLGIIFLGGYKPGKNIDREDFIAKVEDYVEGEREPIGEFDEAYKVDFTFEGDKFSFEDSFVMGFNGPVRKVHLKCIVDNNFTLNFTEKQVNATVRSEMLLASEIPDELPDKGPQIKAAKEFDEFVIQTNDIPLTNKILNDKRVISVFMGYKNKDNRGRPYFSIKIMQGVIALHFHNSAILNPSLLALQSEVSTLENYIDKIMVIANKIKS